MLALATRSVGAQPAGRAVAGVVVDPSGAVLLGARVELRSAAAAEGRTTVTDNAGSFLFDRVAPGRYDVVVTFQGFRPTTVHVSVDARSPGPLRITLPLAGVTQEITVSNAPAEVNTTAASNVDAVTVDQSMLANLPVFDLDYVATLSQFLDAGSIGTAGATISSARGTSTLLYRLSISRGRIRPTALSARLNPRAGSRAIRSRRRCAGR